MSGGSPLGRGGSRLSPPGADSFRGRRRMRGDGGRSEFVFLFRSSEADYLEHMDTAELAQRSMLAWVAWIRDLEAKGSLKNPGQPLERSGKVVRAKGNVTDGPFAEAKDLVLGFIVVEATDIEHAAS